MSATTALHPSDLEPSLVSARTYVTRRRQPVLDAAVVIGAMFCLLTLIPARLIVPGTTEIGRPALILCLLMFAWWVQVRLTSQHLVLIGPQPLRWALLVFTVPVLISYAIGQLRGLTSLEANGADSFLLFTVAFAGVILMTADGISNFSRLELVVKLMVWCGAFVGLVALLQYVLQFDVTEYLNVPGLEQKRVALGFESRGDGIRVASTTIHYIELSTVMATILPFAIHLAVYAKNRKSRVRFAIAAFLCAAAIPATISRTGMLALGIVLLVLVPVWTWRRRYNMLAVITAFIGAFVVVQPGLVSTMTHLFDDPSNNPAFTVRQERYPLVWHYVGQRPWFGRGTGTYVSPQYQILDNEWLAYLISNGIIGVATLALLHLTGIVLALMAFRRAENSEVRHLCAAAIATQLIALVVAGTYDSLSFLTYAMTVALTLGICGTLWRLTHPKRMVRTSTTRWFAADTN
jgi:hypothetical protein